jgi:hypothetical protein
MNKIKSLARRAVDAVNRHKVTSGAVALAGAVGGSLASAGMASATTYDPTSSLTSLADTTGTQMGPIVIAVIGGMIGVALLFWGGRFVWGVASKGRAHI